LEEQRFNEIRSDQRLIFGETRNLPLGEESEVRTKDPSDSTGTFTPRFVLLAARSSLVPRVIRIVSVRNPAPRIAGNSQEAIPIARVTIRILQPLTRAALIAHR
jgi:hypothetical protein